MKNFLINLKKFASNCINAGNVVLHLILGAGIAMLFLQYERSIAMQLAITTLMPLVICGFLEFCQGFIPNVKRNIYDVANSAIAGLITGIVFLSIYGWKLDEDINHNQLPKEGWFYAGWILIAVSTIIWVAKNFIKKK